MPGWRNWQTRKVKDLVGFFLYGFKSRLRHCFSQNISDFHPIKPLRSFVFTQKKETL